MSNDDWDRRFAIDRWWVRFAGAWFEIGSIATAE
jgi:hypothetical protein